MARSNVLAATQKRCGSDGKTCERHVNNRKESTTEKTYATFVTTRMQCSRIATNSNGTPTFIVAPTRQIPTPTTTLFALIITTLIVVVVTMTEAFQQVKAMPRFWKIRDIWIVKEQTRRQFFNYQQFLIVSDTHQQHQQHQDQTFVEATTSSSSNSISTTTTTLTPPPSSSTTKTTANSILTQPVLLLKEESKASLDVNVEILDSNSNNNSDTNTLVDTIQDDNELYTKRNINNGDTFCNVQSSISLKHSANSRNNLTSGEDSIQKQLLLPLPSLSKQNHHHHHHQQQQQQQPPNEDGDKETIHMTSPLSPPPPTKSVANTLTIKQQPLFSTRTILRKAIAMEYKKSIFVSCMAGLAGFCDVLYASRFSCYVNMMTGSTIKAIRAAFYNQWNDLIFFVSLVMSYLAGTMYTNRQQYELLQQQQQQDRIQILHQEMHSLKQIRNGPSESIPTQSSSSLSNTITSTLPIFKKKKLTKSKSIETILPICAKVAPMIWFLFFIADIPFVLPSTGIGFGSIKTMLTNSVVFSSRYSAVPLAFAYGILNTVATEATGGTILYALTGHFTKIGKAITDLTRIRSSFRLLLEQQQQNQQEQHAPSEQYHANNNPVINMLVDEKEILTKVRLLVYHSIISIGFMIGVITALILCSNIPTLFGSNMGYIGTRAVQLQAEATTTTTTFLSPNVSFGKVMKWFPINTVLGTLYVSVLLWYGRQRKLKEN